MKESINIIDKEHVYYLINEYAHLLESKERMPIYHAMSYLKSGKTPADENMMAKLLKEGGWLTPEQTWFDLSKHGYESFSFTVASKIASEHPDDIFFNYCKVCEKLARTSSARQCYHCGYNWHQLRVAGFEINSAFNVREGSSFLIGNLTDGEIQNGLTIDLARSGFGKRPIIKSIEFVFKKENNIPGEEVSLLIEKLSERAIKRLNNGAKTQVDIFELKK